MKRMYDEKEVKDLAKESINVEYNADGELEHNDPEVFNEDVEFYGRIIKNDEEIGPKVILDYAHPVSTSNDTLQFVDNNFQEGTYVIECSDDGSNLEFAGVVVVNQNMIGFCVNYDSLYGDTVRCFVFYENNKIQIQFFQLSDYTPISLDQELIDYTVKLVKIA